MLHDNIRRYRKEKNLTQEEMAAKLHVVRQTVSKWEKGLSVPDAALLPEIAALLDVPVCQLLGIKRASGCSEDFSQDLAQVREQLDIENRQRELTKRAGEKRGLILLLSFAVMFSSLFIKNALFSAALSIGCLLLSVCILYRNLPLLTNISEDDPGLRILRITTFFNAGILILCIIAAILTAAEVISLSERAERMFALLLIDCIMLLAGTISPRLPFSRHTGLRLPWTLQDQDTWNLAHRIIGWISLPLACLYTACALTIENFELVTLIAMLLWIGIPGGISCLFFLRKMRA